MCVYGEGAVQRPGTRKEWSCLSALLSQGKSHRASSTGEHWANRWQEDLLHSLENMMIRNRFQLLPKFFLFWTTKLPRNEDTQTDTHMTLSPASHSESQHFCDSSVEDLPSKRNHLLTWNIILRRRVKQNKWVLIRCSLELNAKPSYCWQSGPHIHTHLESRIPVSKRPHDCSNTDNKSSN